MALLTPEQAARELAISTRQLRWLTTSGRIRYVNLGRGTQREARRYDQADIAAFIEAVKCQYSSVTVRPSTRTTSNFVVEDIQVLRERPRRERRKMLKKS